MYGKIETREAKFVKKFHRKKIQVRLFNLRENPSIGLKLIIILDISYKTDFVFRKN